MRPSLRLATLAAALTLSASPALADPVNSGQWYEFIFGNAVSFANGCAGGCVPSSGGNAIDAPASPWTFTSAAPFEITVTDAFNRVNLFSLFNFGTLVGSTSAPSNTGSCGSDPAVCSVDPLTSHATFALAAGAYSFEISNDLGPSGAGYFRIDPAAAVVPEPSTVALLAGGLGALAVAARRRRRADA